MTTRIYTILADKNPDTLDGFYLANSLSLDPRDVSNIMGRDAFEIFVPVDVTDPNANVTIDKLLQQFKNLGYAVEEKP
jgi:hypothetical protein